MKFAFQIDPINTLNFSTDTSWQLMIEASKHGQVFYYTPSNLFWLNGELLANIQEVNIKNNQYQLSTPSKNNLLEMDIIFIRQDPPYDMNYLTSTYLLEKISDQVLVVNDPKAIRDFPEKLSVLDYPDLLPPTLITSNFLEAKAFAKTYKEIIIKPLYSFAGQDIFLIKENDSKFLEIFNKLLTTYNTPVIVQKFINKVTQGDKRIILVDGNPIGAYNRIPQDGDILANAARGGKVFPAELSSRDLEICERIKPKLIDNNLLLVGIDVIDGYLTEINITSPTGVPVLQKFYDLSITQTIFNKILSKIIKK